MKPLPEPDNPWVLVGAGAVLVLIALALGTLVYLGAQGFLQRIVA